MFEHSCRICGGSQALSHIAVQPELKLRTCSICEMVALDIDCEAAQYVKMMEERFFSDDFVNSHDWYEKWLSSRRARRQLKQIARFKREGHLLEIGPGGGEFLSAAKLAGFAVSALDISPAVSNYVSSVLGVETTIGSVDSLPLLARKFDLVVLSHVLEHCDDPLKALGLLHSVLESGSIIYIAVPNVGSWPARLGGWKPYVPYHLYYFAPDTLSRALHQSGFEVVWQATSQDLPSWAITLARTLAIRVGFSHSFLDRGARIGRKRGSSLATLWKLISIGVGYVFAPICWLQNFLMKGDEIAVIARPAAKPR